MSAGLKLHCTRWSAHIITMSVLGCGLPTMLVQVSNKAEDTPTTYTMPIRIHPSWFHPYLEQL